MANAHPMSIQKCASFLLFLIFQVQALAAESSSIDSNLFLRKEPAEKVIWYGGLVAKMITFYGQSCANGEGEGCFNLAMIYDTGDASVQNKTQASVYYKQSCELDFALACNNLGILFALGDGVEKDPSTASRYFDKACQMKEEIGCKNKDALHGSGFAK